MDMCSEGVAALLERWKAVDSAGSDLVRCEDESSASRPEAGVLSDEFLDLSGDHAREQLAVLKDLASQPAGCMSDVLAKLHIWAELTCPAPSDVLFLTPADRLVLSIYNDLERMAV